MINKSKFQKLKKIDAKNIFLRKFTFGDINKSYLSWMNDFEITKYTESRDKKYSLQDLKNYYSEYGDNLLSPWFCICTKNDSKHIGNIKLDVREKWLRGNLGLFLGDRNYWRKGYAYESIKALVFWAFTVHGMEKIRAGVLDVNFPSQKLFEKSGFCLEGKFEQEVPYDNGRVALIQYGIDLNQFKNNYNFFKENINVYF